MADDRRNHAGRIFHIIAAFFHRRKEFITQGMCADDGMRAIARLLTGLQTNARENRFCLNRHAGIDQDCKETRQRDQRAQIFATPAHHARLRIHAHRHIRTNLSRSFIKTRVISREIVELGKQTQSRGGI